MNGIYKIAERIIEIESLYPDVHDYCKEYNFSGTPDFKVQTTIEDIYAERKKSAQQNKLDEIPTVNYSDGYLEELAVYRKIAANMINYDTFLFHGSAISVDGQAYLFTAKSGTGKSTHTRLWRKLFGERAKMVNDDKPLIRVDGDCVTVYGTPYNGKHHLGTNTSSPLKAVCILTRSQDNYIKPIDKSEAFALLLQQTYRPDDSELLVKTLSLIDRMAKNVGLYILGCNMDISAAEVAYNGMKG